MPENKKFSRHNIDFITAEIDRDPGTVIAQLAHSLFN